MRKGKDGKFVRTRHLWTPDKWDDGFIGAKGKFCAIATWRKRKCLAY